MMTFNYQVSFLFMITAKMVRFELMIIFFVKLTKMWTKFECKVQSIIALKIVDKFSFAKDIFTTDMSSS